MQKWKVPSRVSLQASVLGALLLFHGCAKKDSSEATLGFEAVIKECPLPSANQAWTPSVSGMAGSNHDTSVTVDKDLHTATGVPLTGLAQQFDPTGPHVVTFSIDMTEDLLSSGSLSLVAEVTDFPSEDLVGGAWPVLISLHDGVNELVDVRGCDSNGFFDCTSGLCAARASCGPNPDGAGESAFLGSSAASRRDKWEQHQSIGTSDYLSVNTFPTCNWASGSPACPFNSTFFSAGKLRTGTYTAKYVLLTSNWSYVGSSYKAGLKVTAIKKKDDNTVANGAMDVNVILVGSDNILASQAAKGQENLNALFQHVHNHYSATQPGIKLGAVNVYDWSCDAISDIHVDYTGLLLKYGSVGLPPAGDTRAMNVFLVNAIEYDGPGTIMGVAGGILGSMIDGTSSSGVIVATFADLAGMNPDCDGIGGCAISDQEKPFINMGGTISHEMGHFLGLNHLSEGDGTYHDWTPDSPECVSTDTNGRITINTCRQEAACYSVCDDADYSGSVVSDGIPYCATETACQFNHVMWWTTKNYNNSGEGDGSLFSVNSSSLLNYNPYVQ